MITAKRIWYGAVLLLVGALLASSAAYLLVDDETLVDWIAARAGAAAGVRIDYAPAVEVSRRLSPALSVSNLTVADPDTGYRVHTGSLGLRVSLPWLLLGRLDILRLWLGDTRVELTAANDPSVKVIPWKSAATTYGPLLFGPFTLGRHLRCAAAESGLLSICCHNC